MDWFRFHPKATVAIAGAAGLLVVLLLVVLSSGSGGAKEPSSLGPAMPTTSVTPLKVLPTPTATASPTSVADAFHQALGGLAGGSLSMPGLPGKGGVKHLPRHRIDLSVTSEAPIGTVGYIVPTSLRESYGIDKKVGRSWHLSTTAYGDPDYAQLFIQAGSRGYPITCTISVDGRVTDRRSTEGPYGQMICQG